MEFVELLLDYFEVAQILLFSYDDWIWDAFEQINFYLGGFFEWLKNTTSTLFEILKECLHSVGQLSFSSKSNAKSHANWYEESKAIFFKLSHTRFRFLLWINTKVSIIKSISEYYRLLKWVRNLIGSSHNITNFREDWADGTALCALMEALVPGSCPRHDTLHPVHKLINLDLALRLAETHLSVNPHLKPDEIMMLEENIEAKLQVFLTTVRTAAERMKAFRRTNSLKGQHYCFARGLGLVMATKNQRASFSIYMKTEILSSVLVEIQGPNSERYTEVITQRSPRKKRHVSPKPSSRKQMMPTRDNHPIITQSKDRPLDIIFEYEIESDKIQVKYIPQLAGRYIISVIYRGHPTFNSPFHVTVYDESPIAAKKHIVSKTQLNLLPTSQLAKLNLYDIQTSIQAQSETLEENLGPKQLGLSKPSTSNALIKQEKSMSISFNEFTDLYEQNKQSPNSACVIPKLIIDDASPTLQKQKRRSNDMGSVESIIEKFEQIILLNNGDLASRLRASSSDIIFNPRANVPLQRQISKSESSLL